MRRFIPLIALLLGGFLISAARAEGLTKTFEGFGDGLTYTSVVAEDALGKCPAWLETAENPPVSVRQAMRLADARKRTLVHNTARYHWERQSISLEYFQGAEIESSKRSYWRIHYIAEAMGTDPVGEFDLCVLMDGKLVEPDVGYKAKEWRVWRVPEPVPVVTARAEGLKQTFEDFGDGEIFTSVIAEDSLRKCPAWLETAESPPVSVRQAMRLADARKRTLVHNTARYHWERQSISLYVWGAGIESSKRFYWCIHYIGEGPCGGCLPEFDLFVLMDGKLVEPVVKELGH